MQHEAALKKVIGNPSSKGSQPGSYPVTVARLYLWYDFEFEFKEINAKAGVLLLFRSSMILILVKS